MGFIDNFDVNLAYRPAALRPESKPERAGVLTRVLAYSFIVAIGSGAAYYYSDVGPRPGYIVLLVGLWFAGSALFSSRGRVILGSLLKADILLWFMLEAMTLVFMLFESEGFTLADYRANLVTVVILFVGAFLGLRRDLRGSVALAVFTVITVAAAIE